MYEIYNVLLFRAEVFSGAVTCGKQNSFYISLLFGSLSCSINDVLDVDSICVCMCACACMRVLACDTLNYFEELCILSCNTDFAFHIYLCYHFLIFIQITSHVNYDDKHIKMAINKWNIY